MYQKGSITVYLSLTLAILVSLIGTALYSVQCAGARVQAVHGTDQGLYSLFARYDIPMLERFHLFFLDGSFGRGRPADGTAVQHSGTGYCRQHGWREGE